MEHTVVKRANSAPHPAITTRDTLGYRIISPSRCNSLDGLRVILNPRNSPTIQRPGGPPTTTHEYQLSHHTLRVWGSIVEADRALKMWDDNAPHIPATAHGTVTEVRARKARKPFLASMVTQFPI